MNNVVVRFDREAGEVELDSAREYRVSVDGGPYSVFRSPWKHERLEELIASLRNTTDDRPNMESMRQIGRELGEAIYNIKGLPRLLVADTTVCWQLDYPELARIPWELATSEQLPYHHLLLQGISFVRRIPAAVADPPAEWPTGKNESLRLLYAWSQQAGSEVPHEEHREQLNGICSDYGVEMIADAVPNVNALAELCREKRFHFVHLLAHGGRVGKEWGLKLAEQTPSGEQIARALLAGGTTPALVTVSACDSANEPNNSFGSVAYQLHVYGIPLVLASQFRLRKAVSVASVAHVYKGLFGGAGPLGILGALRRQVSVEDNEAWANEVLYSRYRPESLQELSALAQQQAALRRARSIEKRRQIMNPEQKRAALADLEQESTNLSALAATLEKAVRRNREALAETYGLLGSLQRRIAELRTEPPDPPDAEDLRKARSFYEKGFRADANSYYCGINVVHLSLRLNDQRRADEFIPRVRFAAENAAEGGGDFWAYATLGDLEVYSGRVDEAADSYRKFVAGVEAASDSKSWRVQTLQSSRRPLDESGRIFVGDESQDLRRAVAASLAVLDSAIRSNS